MENILEEIGLTPSETKVYLALNKIGTSSISPIVNEARISNSKIYIILDKLIKKGLASKILINKVRYYKATEPERLLDFLEDKKKKILDEEEKIKKILPNLLLSKKNGDDREVEVYEGFNGLKLVRERMLNLMKKGDELLILGASKFSTSKYEHYWENYHKRRIAKGISCRYLMGEETRAEEGKKREKWKLTKVKYIKQGSQTPIRVDVCLDYISISLDAVNPYVILIKSKEVGQSFKDYFEFLWKHANK